MLTDRQVRATRAVERACSDASGVVDLCRRLQSALDQIVPSDRWCGFAVDPAALIGTNGFHDEGLDPRLFPRLLELEYGAEDEVNLIPALARTASGVATLSQATGRDLASSARWRDVIAPSGLHHELRAAFRDGRNVWGALVLLRASDVTDFTTTEIDFIARVAPTIADGFRRALVRQHLDHAEDAREAGILLLTGDPLEIRVATPAGSAWLDELDDGLGGAVPLSVQSAARSARARRGVPAVRSLTRQGRWVTITAELTVGSADQDVGVVIQPSRPAEIAQIVGAAHGLTPRETEIVLLVASGQTNREIATRLAISPYTVADHLKSIFAKLDVASRSEMTSRLFFDHYAKRVIDGQPVGVDGWFLSG